MKIERRSPYTGKMNTMDLPITDNQLKAFHSHPREKIQDIFPELSPEQREFILTGYTPEDWAEIFPPERVEGLVYISPQHGSVYLRVAGQHGDDELMSTPLMKDGTFSLKHDDWSEVEGTSDDAEMAHLGDVLQMLTKGAS